MYVCGEWEHGQLGLPLGREFSDPTSIDPPRTPYQAPVPSTGVRINDKGEELHPIAAVDADELVSHLGICCWALLTIMALSCCSCACERSECGSFRLQ